MALEKESPLAAVLDMRALCLVAVKNQLEVHGS